MADRLRGFVAQGMDGRKASLPRAPIPQMLDVFTAGSGTFVPAASGILSLYVFGGGGGGLGSNAAGSPGGGGGGAAFKRIRVAAGQGLPWTVGAGGANITVGVGNTGGASSVTLPNGLVVSASGGQGGQSGPAGGAGGAGAGGDVNSTGGAGGNTPSDNGTAGGNSGDAGGVHAAANGGGGGGVAGLGSITSGIAFPISARAGQQTGAHVGMGGWGDNTGSGNNGGSDGRILMILERYAARP